MLSVLRFILLAVSLVAALAARAGEKIPVQKFLNRFPADLATSLDPRLRDAEPERTLKLDDFKGWKNAIFSFNAKRRLVGIAFTPQGSLTEEAAMKLIQEDLGFTPPGRPPFRSKGSSNGLIAYRDMPGIVTTLNLHMEGSPPNEVAEIGFFSRLKWDK